MTERLEAEEIGTAFWLQMTPPGIRFRWDPALVAKMAKVSESPRRWQEEPEWLRLMPQLITWHVIGV